MRTFGAPSTYLQRRYYSRWRSEAVEAFVGARHLRRVIDYGCGDGALSLSLAHRADEVVLFDPSPAALAAVRAALLRAHSQAKTVLLDRGIDEWRDRPADLVLCVGVLAHVQDPLETLDEVASLVAPNGSLVLELTDAAHPIGRAQVWFSRIRARLTKGTYAWNALDANEVLAHCGKLGFSVESLYRYGLPCHPGDWVTEEALYRLGLGAFGAVGQPRAGTFLTCERMYYLRRHA